MEKSTKVILSVVGIIIFTVMVVKYLQFYVYQDYTFLTQVNCDPAIEACFQVLEENQDPETGIVFYDGSPYKYVEMPASVAPVCLEEMTCMDFTCDQVGEECATYYCDVNDEESLDPEWEECVGVPYEEMEGMSEEAEEEVME
jgi:hypothetical protein